MAALTRFPYPEYHTDRDDVALMSEERLEEDHSVKLMCRVLRVSRSGYYAWEARPQSEHANRDEQLLAVIKGIFERSESLYGAPRVHAELRLEHGERVASAPAPSWW